MILSKEFLRKSALVCIKDPFSCHYGLDDYSGLNNTFYENK